MAWLGAGAGAATTGAAAASTAPALAATAAPTAAAMGAAATGAALPAAASAVPAIAPAAASNILASNTGALISDIGMRNPLTPASLTQTGMSPGADAAVKPKVSFGESLNSHAKAKFGEVGNAFSTFGENFNSDPIGASLELRNTLQSINPTTSSRKQQPQKPEQSNTAPLPISPGFQPQRRTQQSGGNRLTGAISAQNRKQLGTQLLGLAQTLRLNA